MMVYCVCVCVLGIWHGRECSNTVELVLEKRWSRATWKKCGTQMRGWGRAGRDASQRRQMDHVPFSPCPLKLQPLTSSSSCSEDSCHHFFSHMNFIISCVVMFQLQYYFLEAFSTVFRTNHSLMQVSLCMMLISQLQLSILLPIV